MRSLEGAEACEWEPTQLCVPDHWRGDGGLSVAVVMHARTTVCQHPDVDTDDHCDASHVQVDQVDTLRTVTTSQLQYIAVHVSLV